MNKVILLISALLLTVPCPAFAKQEVISQGIQEILSGEPSKLQINERIAELKKGIEQNPDDYRRYEMLALVYDYIDDYENELMYYELAAKYYPIDGEEADVIFGNLARAYINLERFDEAKPAIDKALSVNPDNPFNHIHLLNYYIAKDKYKEASEELKFVSGADKQRDYYYDFYVYALKVLKKEGACLMELFKEAARANPDNYMSHRTYATALRNHTTDMEKDFPVIIGELKKSLELNPQYIPSYVSMANAYMFGLLETKNKTYLKEALRWFNKADKLDPKNVKLAYAMGNFFAYTNNYDRAIEKLEYAISLGDTSEQIVDRLADVYNSKAYSYFLKGKNLKKGLEAAEKGLKLRPQFPYLLSTKAELLYKLKKFDESNECIEKAALISSDPQLFAHFGSEQQKLGNYVLAEKYYDKSLEIDPQNIEVICNIGLIYTRKKEFEKAIRCYTEVIKALPGDPRGYYNMGIVYHNMGNKAEALKQAAKLRELKHDDYAKELEGTINTNKAAEGKERLR
ncbi:MAG: tetratricopeptide repeat protein [Candidatus Omnitrophica bacterium]|nr:tetratricopeptide repeat protein [Candidatus Omnitrophota bacterium]